MDLASNTYIDLGDKFGIVLLLETFAHLRRIEIDAKHHIKLVFRLPDTKNDEAYRSAFPFTSDEIIKEKKRILRYANGYISKEDFIEIFNSWITKTNKKLKLDNVDEWTHIESVRKLWFYVNEIPYYRMIIDINEDMDTVINADSNVFFDKKFTEYYIEKGVDIRSNDDVRLMFASDVLQDQTQNLYPENPEVISVIGKS